MATATLQLSIASTQLIYLAALIAKPSPHRRLFIVPIILVVAFFFQFALQNHSFLEYNCACYIVGLLFTASDYIFLTDVQRELFVKGQKEPAFHLSLFERVKWATPLLINPRCIGWSHESTNTLPPRPPPSVTRWKFIFQELGKLARDVVLFEVLTTYIMKTDYFSIHGRSMAADGFFWRMVNMLVYGNYTMISMDMFHRALGILGVLFGFVQPQDWVPLFGSIRDAYSLQRFWGRSWHQILRRLGSSHGRFMAHDVLRLKKGTKVSSFVQLSIAFALSGIMHAAGDYSLLGNWSEGGALRFFLLQVVGITIEIMVINVAKWLSIRRSWHYVGYVWVIVWFTYTIPDWMDPLHRAGFASISNFGILDRLLGWVHT